MRSATSTKTSVMPASDFVLFKQHSKPPTLTISAKEEPTIHADHDYNSSVIIITPSAPSIDVSQYSYHSATIQLQDLLNPAFLAFCRTFKLYALSNSADPDLAIRSSVLHLRVPRETYTALGLLGSKSVLDAHQYKITIDLAATEFVPGNKLYGRALKGFTEVMNQSFEIQVYAECKDGNGTETVELGLPNATKLSPTTSQSKLLNITIPLVDQFAVTSFGRGQDDDSRESALKLYEWIGMVSIGADRLRVSDSVDPFICIYDQIEPSKVGSCYVTKIEGFISPHLVETVIASLRD
jgi:Ribonuclease P 40kDa (Rpp40) subunit